jgi:hypothetical protein
MWIYNKTNNEYKVKWGSKYYKLQPKMNEIEDEIAKAFFGYNVDIYNSDPKEAEKEAQRLVDIIKQRWALAGVEIKDDSWLEFNEPNSKWLISDSHDEIIDMLQPETQKGKAINGNPK